MGAGCLKPQLIAAKAAGFDETTTAEEVSAKVDACMEAVTQIIDGAKSATSPALDDVDGLLEGLAVCRELLG